MVKLLATCPFDNLLPRDIGSVSLTPRDLGPMFEIAPFRRQRSNVTEALGLPWPEPGRFTAQDEARLLWISPGAALLSGKPPPQDLAAAVIDQSDGLATLAIGGADARDVLARLVPIDLSPKAFGTDATARTLVGHMTASVTRIGPSSFEIQVFRSMARTLVAELTEAAEHIDARLDLER